MAQKKGRLKVLRQLLEKKAYDNQEDLLIDLEKEGFKTTQSTLSRDMFTECTMLRAEPFTFCLPWVWLTACRKEETASGLRRVSGFFLLSFPAILLC